MSLPEGWRAAGMPAKLDLILERVEHLINNEDDKAIKADKAKSDLPIANEEDLKDMLRALYLMDKDKMNDFWTRFFYTDSDIIKRVKDRRKLSDGQNQQVGKAYRELLGSEAVDYGLNL